MPATNRLSMQLPRVVQLLSVRDKSIGILFIVYLVLQIQSFRWALDHEFLYVLVKFSVGVVIFILLLSAKLKGIYKLVTIIGYFALLYTISHLNLWKISAKAYLNDHQPAFTQAVNSLKSKNHISLTVNKLESVSDTILPKTQRGHIMALGDSTSVIEIEAVDGNVLFIFSRFIDNGYGFLYVRDFKILKAVRPRVVYDLTSWVQLAENWYYVSFT